MKIIALLLLIVGIVKLCLVTILNKMELKELVYNTPVLVDVSPGILQALITADGLICVIGGIILCL